ncbi:hypothetical protein [Amycolatopsis sp. YIM 10]|uniref:hypothetical protein n=1 Tax=Amycolatopsis sp. YIM 10 TaxID=2653857 RepID=UPI0012904F8A|nr:hypothetical protein [Amycolatopsis sp. YIM 10]QFU90944.1 hypothetical protein YIM_28860 [Amycolatopsis sp. YIM 10]
MTEQTDSMKHAAFFAALSMHFNAHPHLPGLATVAWCETLHVPSGLAEALDWAHTLGGSITASIGTLSSTETAVHINGTIAGHRVEVFAVDRDRLHELLPPDEGQPRHQRTRSITLAELETYLADTAAPATETAQDQHDDPGNDTPPAEEDAHSEKLEQQFTHALGDMFRGALLLEISSSDAYGALKYKVLQRCQATGETPEQVLDSISYADRTFAAEANDPAAFLASRVTTD